MNSETDINFFNSIDNYHVSDVKISTKSPQLHHFCSENGELGLASPNHVLKHRTRVHVPSLRKGSVA
jgi:hypothetical protein